MKLLTNHYIKNIMICLKNGSKFTVRLPPSVIPKNLHIESSWKDRDYNFVKEWIDHKWHSNYVKLPSHKYKTLEKDLYLNSDVFRRLTKKSKNPGKISELFVKETFKRHGFSYKESPKYISEKKIKNIIPDGLITYDNDKNIIIEVKSLTEHTGTASEKMYGILFKYTAELERLRKKGVHAKLLVILCARQQDEKHGKLLINAFNKQSDSYFMNTTVKHAKLAGIMGFIPVRNLDRWITSRLVNV